jgi:hypothetical protein
MGMYLVHHIVNYSNPLGLLEYMALMGFLLGIVALAAHRDSYEGRRALCDRNQRPRRSAV